MTAAGAAPTATPPDPHSYARPDEARVEHVALDLTVDFERRQLRGRAALRLSRAPGAARVVLDTKALDIRAVTDAAGRRLEWALGAVDPIFGRPLAVALPDETVDEVVVWYETTAAGEGLLWLDPAQTAGGAHPFVFSQGHAILTRSWIPTQDSLGLRQSYDARVTVPDGLLAVMSADRLTPDGVAVEGGGRRFDFRMPHPIPTYLIALAVGDLASTALGERTGVIAERATIERACAEFTGLNAMLDATERLAGPYPLPRADVIVLPPAFPFGGMENPQLTFVSPTLIAGDRSLTTVVAHELAHSWSGNLVTPATWSDFWINEGFTVYLELRVNEALFGPERAAMLEVYGYRELAAEMARLGPASPDTRLHVELAGRDPAVVATAVPYIKGAALLRALERAVGRERFDPWLRGWFERHAFRAVAAGDFVDDARTYLLTRTGDDEFPLEAWVYDPGLPDDATEPTSALLARVDAEVAAFVNDGPVPASALTEWSPQEWRHFLNSLPRTLDPARLAALDAALGLSDSGNAEVLFAWLRLAVRGDYPPAVAAAERFLTAQGRGKFVRPLYAALAATEWGMVEARRIYALARPRYHGSVAALVDVMLGWGGMGEAEEGRRKKG